MNGRTVSCCQLFPIFCFLQRTTSCSATPCTQQFTQAWYINIAAKSAVWVLSIIFFTQKLSAALVAIYPAEMEFLCSGAWFRGERSLFVSGGGIFMKYWSVVILNLLLFLNFKV